MGGGTSSIMGYGMFFWLPSFFVRSYHFSLAQISWYLGALTFFGGSLESGWVGGSPIA